MMVRVVFLVFFVQVLFSGLVYGQGNFARPGSITTPQAPQTAPANSDNPDWSLPPLQTLINLAIDHSPLLQSADINILLVENGMKDIRREWMRRINFMADARYGTMFNYSNMIPGAPLEPTIMMNYGVGAMAGISLADLFDRKRTKQQARWRIDQARISKEESINALTQTVITAYYNILSIQKTLAMNTEIFLMAGLVYERVKLDLAQNKISYNDYVTETQTYLTAQNAVELRKNELWRSVRILEIIVGVELINAN